MRLVQVKLNLSLLEDISDDIDFCFKLAREESVILLPGKDITSVSLIMNITLRVISFNILCICGWPGTAVGLKNWLRITFAADASSIEEAFKRIKCFYLRHAKTQSQIIVDLWFLYGQNVLRKKKKKSV